MQTINERRNRRFEIIRSVLKDVDDFVIHVYNKDTGAYGTAVLCDDNTVNVYEEKTLQNECKSMKWYSFIERYRYYVAHKLDHDVPEEYFKNNEVEFNYINKSNLNEDEFLRLSNAENIAYYIAKYNKDFGFKEEYVDIIAYTLCPYLSKNAIDIKTLYKAQLILKKDYNLIMLDFPFKYSEVEERLKRYNIVKTYEDYYKTYRIKCDFQKGRAKKEDIEYINSNFRYHGESALAIYISSQNSSITMDTYTENIDI